MHPSGPSLLVPDDVPPSAHCHARSVRLPAGADADLVGDALDKAALHWWARTSVRRPRLWVDHVPWTHDSPKARGRLRAELRRPVPAEGCGLRVVVLYYADQLADLVLVAHRARFDARSLRSVVEVLLGRIGHDRFGLGGAHSVTSNAEALDRWREAFTPARAEWAVGDGTAGDRTGVVDIPLPGRSTDVLATVAVATGLVLGRYEGQESVVLGALATVPERPQSTLGAFDAGVLLPLDLSGTRSTAELVDEAGRTLGRTGWCDRRSYSEFTGGSGDRVFAGVLGEALEAESGECLPCLTAPFPLTVVPVRGNDGTLRLTVHHRVAEVDADAASRFAHHVARAHEQLVTLRDGSVPADLDLVHEDEHRRMVALGRPSASLDLPRARIDEVFSDRVAAAPDMPALVYEGRSLTYAETAARAERFAAALRSSGVKPGERVGVCLERSLDLVVTMLAVLKADAVYVPMDPAYPAERLAYTAEDANLRLVVTEKEDFPGGEGLRRIRPEELAAHRGGLLDPERPRPHAGEAAYVIYTSGSTGRPKGVVVPHRNVVALLHATREEFGLGGDHTWTLFHSSAFDFSVWEIWGSLLTGARLVIVPYWVSRSPERFHGLLVRERVTVLNQTPSAFSQLMEADRHRTAALSVRLVIFGGEPLDTRVLRGWFDRYPEERCRLVNMFGITETTVHVTAQTVTRREAVHGSRSVGTALPGWYVYVLDERGRPVPCGVPGEIHVGGEGVALGYLGRPELTAERFFDDPFARGRVYRTGDRGRLRADGRLEHLGRLDTQVKVRGFRIELDEIRNVLLDDPAVTAAAVVVGGVATRDAAGVRIDAYVVSDNDTAAIRRRAAKVLPEFMLPTTITSLAELPLTSNGKLDTGKLPDPFVRTALPAVSAAQGEAAPSESASTDTSDIASALAQVWGSVLGVRVGPDDNFFELGGNSLYAVRVAAAMRERDLPALSMRELYLNPTVNGLVRVLEGEGRT